MSDPLRADQLKGEGNEWLKLGKYQKALDSYSAALDFNTTPIILCNRAFAYLKLELPGGALADADAAIQMDSENIKAYYRKACAHLMLGHLKEALAGFKKVVSIVPDDKDANEKFQRCQKALYAKKFAEAIQHDESEPLHRRLKVDQISVPTSYTGPRIVNDTITPEFVKEMMEHFRQQKNISCRDAVFILLKSIEFFKTQPNVVPITVPVGKEMTVCGDTHGQYYDLLNIFKINGEIGPENVYLFNGDYVDRGSYSCEVMLLLLATKLLYPDSLFLSRGNHEGSNLNRVYGFDGEVKQKYDDKVLALFQECFNTLPLAHIIQNSVFVTHGGLFGRDNVTVDDLNAVNRFKDVPEDGLMCDCLWADPQPHPGRTPSKRGVGQSFGPDVTKNFLDTNKLQLVVRSHEVKDEGYVVEHGGKCITVFSAPNYCDQVGNKGALIRFRNNNGTISEPKFTTYAHVSHPGVRAMAYSSLFAGMGI